MSVKKKRRSVQLMPNGSDIWINIAVIALAVYGTIMIASASMGLSVGDNAYLVKTMIKQLIFVGGGFAAMIVIARRFKLEFLKSGWFSLGIVGMLALLVICRVAFKPVNGAYAWLHIPFPGLELTIQPSEFTKVYCILIVAAFCGDITKRFRKSWDLVGRPIIFILIYFLVIVVLQRDFGSAVVMLLMSCVCFLIPAHEQMKGLQRGLKILFWIGVAGIVFILSPYGKSLIEALPIAAYQKHRFLSALNPFEDKYNTGYQLVNSLISFATGGLFGRGLGNSIRKYTDFPQANTDFILAIVVEELGFFGFVILMAFYLMIVVSLLSYAMKIKNEKAKIILIGTAMYFVIHLFFNIGGVTGMIPLTGVPLLMISAGGSSTLSVLLSIGLSQAVISSYRRGEIQ